MWTGSRTNPGHAVSCYMNGVSLCCSYYRQKVIYPNCPGLPDHCSECIAAPNPEPGATCNTSNGFCEY